VGEAPARVLVVWCPDWPVQAAGAGPDVPAAVLVGQGARRTVLACSAAARASGVRRGQRVRDAQRLCPELLVYQRDEAAEERSFEPVVQAVEDVVAGVEVLRPGLIALAARGPARYHGGEARLAALVREAVADAGTAVDGEPLGCGVGVADGVFAATLAARRPVDEPLLVPASGSAAFLAPYPLRVLDRPELAELLDRLGVRSLGALAGLPPAAVANRFGPVGVRAHRLARGLDPRPPAARRPGEDLSALYVFDPPAERDEPVVFAAKALADRWRAALAAAGVTCASVRIELTTQSGRSSVRSWRNGDALGAALPALALAQRVRWQLEGWRTRAAADAGAAARRQSTDGAGRGRGQGPGAGAGMDAGTGAGAGDVDGLGDVDGAGGIDGAGDLGGTDADGVVADPVVGLRFVPGPLVTDTGSQQALWGRAEVPDRIGRVTERVQALLGHEGVVLLHQSGGRDPAARIERTAWGEPAPTGSSAVAPSSAPSFAGPSAPANSSSAGSPSAAASAASSSAPSSPSAASSAGSPSSSAASASAASASTLSSADPEAPWPGAVPAPWPALVPDEPYPAALLDARGTRLGVTGRVRLTGRPAVLVLDGTRLRVIDWAGPWPYYERPWRTADSRRRARLQVATADGRAFLLALEQGSWQIEGVYQ
jgi:protein ImuB